MQNTIERVYMQASNGNVEAAFNTVMLQHMTVIDLFRSAEDQGCLDLDQYQEIKAELSAINASLHTLAEGSNGTSTAHQAR